MREPYHQDECVIEATNLYINMQELYPQKQCQECSYRDMAATTMILYTVLVMVSC